MGSSPHVPHHDPPGPVRAATPQERGSCIIASVRAGGTGGIYLGTCSSQRDGATRNEPGGWDGGVCGGTRS
eukprot:3706097-Prymnesium_polylepis.1